MRAFSYHQAFDRNLGWVTGWEQESLRARTVAIAGMGGVGGVHLLTLARLGIGGFHIADFDRFDLANFNRQVGAMMSTLDRPKLDVLAEMALDINPELRIGRFAQGVTPENLDQFLSGVDLFVDGFDFFELAIRRQVFARCRELGIPAVTAAPLGLGTAYLIFMPDGMSFERYFRFDDHPMPEQYLRFLMGLTPAGLHRAYLVDPSRIDLAGRRGPSTTAACQLCAGVVASAALKILLRRDAVRPAPTHHQFDAYHDRYVRTRLPRGNGDPRQRLRLAVARRMMSRRAPGSGIPEPADPRTPLDHILHAARWAPSGDNQQPWRIERDGADGIIIHGTQADPANVYEYRDGEPLVLAAGMLLESLRVAASGQANALDWQLLAARPLRIAGRFVPQPGLAPEPTLAELSMRSVDRRPYRTRRLTAAEKAALERSLGDALAVTWHEGKRTLLRAASLNARATDIRLRAPETFRTHQAVVDWRARFSPQGIPAATLGLAQATLGPMQWSMGSFGRTRLMNRLGATATASMQMDLLPGLACAAAFSIRLHRGEGDPTASLLAAGMAIQRFWLGATRLGLVLQPALATLIFADHGLRGRPFTADPALLAKAATLARRFAEFYGPPDEHVFLGRIGAPIPRLPTSRSTRRAQPPDEPRPVASA